MEYLATYEDNENISHFYQVRRVFFFFSNIFANPKAKILELVFFKQNKRKQKRV